MRRVVSGMAILAVGLVVGCSRPDPLGFTPVSGRVMLDGKPLERGEIRFSPDAAAGVMGPQSISPLGPGGAFVLRGPGGRLGAVPWQHRVYLSIPDQDGPPTPPLEEADGKLVARGEPPSPWPAGPRVPSRYLAPATSGLMATITRGVAAKCDFDLVSASTKK